MGCKPDRRATWSPWAVTVCFANGFRVSGNGSNGLESRSRHTRWGTGRVVVISTRFRRRVSATKKGRMRAAVIMRLGLIKKGSEEQRASRRAALLDTKCAKKNHRSRNIHLNSKPWAPGRLQKSKPACRRALKICVGLTFAEGSISWIASTTSAVEKKWVASAGAEADR